MDILQIALIFLICLLSIFLAITGFQVFLILRDLKKALDRLNKVLETEESVSEANLVTTLTQKAHPPAGGSKPKRFYKKVL